MSLIWSQWCVSACIFVSFHHHVASYQNTESKALCGWGRFQFLWPAFAGSLCPVIPPAELLLFWLKLHWILLASTAGYPPSTPCKSRGWFKLVCGLNFPTSVKKNTTDLGGRMAFRMSSLSCLFTFKEVGLSLGGGGEGRKWPACKGPAFKERLCNVERKKYISLFL